MLLWKQITVWVWKFLDFCSSVAKVSILLRYGAAWLGNWWPAFRDNLEWILRFLFQRLKRRGRAADHWPPSGDVKNQWSCASAFPCQIFMAWTVTVFSYLPLIFRRKLCGRHFDPWRRDHFIRILSLNARHQLSSDAGPFPKTETLTMWLLILSLFRGSVAHNLSLHVSIKCCTASYFPFFRMCWSKRVRRRNVGFPIDISSDALVFKAVL